MVINYIKKRTKPVFLEDDIQRAIESIEKKELLLRKAAQVYAVTHTALFYRLKNLGDNAGQIENIKTFSSKHTFQKIFSNRQEELLVKYTLTYVRMYYGLTYQMLRTLYFENRQKSSKFVD